MTYRTNHARKAMTAIAAVLALSTTPALAQDTGTATDPLAPAPVETPAPAPEPAPTVTDTAAPPASTPKVESGKPAAKVVKKTTTTRTTAKRTSVAAAKPATPAPASAAPAPAPAPSETAAPVAAVSPGPMPEPAPVAEPAPQSQWALDNEEALPIAGAAALGLIALGGAGMAMRRRKRRLEAEDFEARQQALDHADHEPAMELDRPVEVAAAPAFVRASKPVHDPVPIKGAPVTKLPNGFDLSRFGPHVQAAYRGPTADNPSLSLRNRLRRASGMDQMARMKAEESGTAAPKPAPANSWQVGPDGNFMLRRDEKRVPETVDRH